MCDEDCEHFKKSEMICNDHSKHANEIVPFDIVPDDAFNKELERVGSVRSVQFTTKYYDENDPHWCQFDNVCTFIFVNTINSGNINYVVGKDLKGNTYMHANQCVISFNSWDD